MTDPAIRLLAAIRQATNQHRREIEQLPEWRRPRLDSRYPRERDRAAGWIVYEPSQWLGLPAGGERNRLRWALAELVDAGFVEVLVYGQRASHVRLLSSRG